MPDRLVDILYFVFYGYYFFMIYTPSMRRFGRHHRKGEVTATRTGVVEIFIDFLTFACWQVFPILIILTNLLDQADFSLPHWTRWAGLSILAGALVILKFAYTQIGGNWSPKLDIQSNQLLVTNGIYRYIRHPIYAGMWLWALSLPLILHNWVGGFGFVGSFALLYWTRMPREETMMVEHFGQEYADYQNRTNRIIPRLPWIQTQK